MAALRPMVNATGVLEELGVYAVEVLHILAFRELLRHREVFFSRRLTNKAHSLLAAAILS